MTNYILKYFHKSILHKLIFVAMVQSVFCILQLCIRPLYINDDHYLFLLLNLVLAWIPLLIVFVLKARKKYSIQLLLFALWFLFFPNAGYVFTDLWHLNDFSNGVIWFDIIMIFSFATNTILVGNLSLTIIHDFIETKFSTKICWIIVCCIFLLSSVGIYQGRFLRFNSWDVLAHPIETITTTIERYSNVFLHPIAYPFTILVAVMLLSQYLLIRVIARSSK